MKPCIRPLAILCVIFAVSALSGCGQNIFKGLTGTTAKTASEELKSGNFDAAISGADAIINSGATGETLQTAYVVKGTAVLMKYQSLPHNLFQSIIDLSDQNDTNIVTTFMETIPIDYQNAILAADALNSANTLASTVDISIASTGPLAPSLNATAQLNRAIANTSVTIKLLTQYLDIQSGGTVTKNTLAQENGLTMATIIQTLTQSPRPVSHYAEAAVNAGNASGIFTSDQLVVLNRVSMLGKNLTQLRTIVNSSNTGTFNLVDHTNQGLGYPAILITADNQETAYTAALTQLVGAMTTGAL